MEGLLGCLWYTCHVGFPHRSCCIPRNSNGGAQPESMSCMHCRLESPYFVLLCLFVPVQDTNSQALQVTVEFSPYVARKFTEICYVELEGHAERQPVLLTGLGLGPCALFTYDVLDIGNAYICLLYTSPSPRDRQKSRMPSSA